MAFAFTSRGIVSNVPSHAIYTFYDNPHARKLAHIFGMYNGNFAEGEHSQRLLGISHEGCRDLIYLYYTLVTTQMLCRDQTNDTFQTARSVSYNAILISAVHSRLGLVTKS